MITPIEFKFEARTQKNALKNSYIYKKKIHIYTLLSLNVFLETCLDSVYIDLSYKLYIITSFLKVVPKLKARF